MIHIRQEEPLDYDEVYRLVEQSFATASHYDGTEANYLNEIRTKETFVPELSFIAEADNGKIVGQIVLYETDISTKNSTVKTLVLSPLSVHPDYFRQGIARLLINYALHQATTMGYTSVFLCGEPEIYHKLGFRASYEYNIFHKDDASAQWCMGRELVDNALQNICGTINIV